MIPIHDSAGLTRWAEFENIKDELLQSKNKTDTEYKKNKSGTDGIRHRRMEIENYPHKQNERNTPSRKKNRREER